MRKALEQKYTNSTLDNLASGERFLREEEYKSEIDTDKDADADTSAELLEEAGSRRPDGVNAIDADSHGQRQPDEERDQHTGTAATGAHIAGRTCSKIRRAPYRGTESEDTPIDVKTSGHVSYLMARHSAPGKAVKASPEPEKKVAVASEPKNPVRMVPELEEKVRAALELVEEVKGGPTDATTLRKNKRTDPDSCAGENRMNLKNSNASSDEEDEEPKIYVFAGRGRRGVDSLVSKQSRLTRIGPTKTVVVRRMRRYRCRTGRYILEFEVERVGDRLNGERPECLWINIRDYEQLWSEGRIRAERDKEDGSCSGDPRDEDGPEGAAKKNEKKNKQH
ncbi:hypothetical protein V7S43_015490 [Phytophthora oleae]|uniref:Chromo domain-containing protein n=1 Tax=Phytophthora oleae TaxID=2107226 RepID=A0ABD3F1Z8_9STRA